MEYVAGKNLNELAKGLKLGQRILVFKHVAGAVCTCTAGVFHGDITPRRVMLASSGTVKVIGYGQSLLKDKTHRTMNKQFAAPEQIRQNTHRREDRDLRHRRADVLSAHGQDPEPAARTQGRADDEAVKLPRPSDLNKKVPAALDDVILACVQRHPDRRPEGMFDVLKGLEDLARSLQLDDGMLKGVAAPEPNKDEPL